MRPLEIDKLPQLRRRQVLFVALHHWNRSSNTLIHELRRNTPACYAVRDTVLNFELVLSHGRISIIILGNSEMNRMKSVSTGWIRRMEIVSS